MKLRVLLIIFLLICLAACSSTKQTAITEEVIFYGEGKHWIVKYIYNPELYEEDKVNWVEIELKDVELVQEDLHDIDIEFEVRDGLITGNLGGMITEINDNVISFLVGTVNDETYKEDKYKITIKLKIKKML